MWYRGKKNTSSLRLLSIIQHIYGRTWGATPCFLVLLPILPKMPMNPPTLNMRGVSVFRKVVVRKRFGEDGLAPDVIFMQTYGQGLSFRNIAPWDVQHIKKTYTPFCSPLHVACQFASYVQDVITGLQNSLNIYRVCKEYITCAGTQYLNIWIIDTLLCTSWTDTCQIRQ